MSTAIWIILALSAIVNGLSLWLTIHQKRKEKARKRREKVGTLLGNLATALVLEQKRSTWAFDIALLDEDCNHIPEPMYDHYIEDEDA
jgi:hypothetical protein